MEWYTALGFLLGMVLFFMFIGVPVALAFLAANTQHTTDAQLGPGLYFFVAYALMSFLASEILRRL